jgi:hypothetical protein
MMWGYPAFNMLGSTPTAVLSMLDENPARVKIVSMGTGASFREDGTVEAEATKEFLLDNFDGLDEFTLIQTHPLWRNNKRLIKGLIEDAATDTASQNTKEEIANAALLFDAEGVSRVIEVTGASHAPRCQLVQSMAREEGEIPSTQRWQLVADDIAYPGTMVGDTLIFEEPHRGDDPAKQWPLEQRPTRVFREYFSLPADRKRQFLAQVAGVTQETLMASQLD